MCIDNFETIENNLLEFTPGSYYKFEALIRNTDGENPLYYEGSSNTNKNILIKTWWVDSEDYYKKIKNEMKVLCDLTGARLYVLLDRMNVKKTLVHMNMKTEDLILQNYVLGNNEVSAKTVFKVSGTCSSIKDSSDRDKRLWMFDIDSKNFELLSAIQDACYPRKFFTLATYKGYHVCVFKSGARRQFEPEVTHPILTQFSSEWSLQECALGLVYMR